MKTTILRELDELVARELREAESFETREEVLCARNRAFGAVLFAFTLDTSLYAERLDWWNKNILDKFNAIMRTKRK